MDDTNRDNLHEKERKVIVDKCPDPSDVRVKQEDCSIDSDRKRKMPLADSPHSKRATMEFQEELVEGHVEPGSRIRQLQAEMEELRRERDKAAAECRRMEVERLDQKKELQLLSSSMANYQEILKAQLTDPSAVDNTSESRRAGELEADTEIQELRRELERVTEENGKYMKENMQMRIKSFESNSRNRLLLAANEELRGASLELENKLQDSELKRARELEAATQDWSKKLDKATEERRTAIEEFRKMGGERSESDTRSRQLLAENEKLHNERLKLKKKMKLLAHSLASLKESEARRVRELHKELEKAAENSGQSLEECRQLIMEQLADSCEVDEAQSEKDNSYITPELFKLDQKCPFCWSDHTADDCRVVPFLKSRLAACSAKFLCHRCLVLHPNRPCSTNVPCQYCGSPEHHTSICASEEHEAYLETLFYH